MCGEITIALLQRQSLRQRVSPVPVDGLVFGRDVTRVPHQVLPCRRHLLLRPADLLLVALLRVRVGYMLNFLECVDDRLERKGCTINQLHSGTRLNTLYQIHIDLFPNGHIQIHNFQIVKYKYTLQNTDTFISQWPNTNEIYTTILRLSKYKV